MKLPRGVFLPNLVTLGNGVCGFASLGKAFKATLLETSSPERAALLTTSAWLILLGMVFDVFDGKLARLSGKTSDLGAQLDSLCDLTTFGLAPAVLVMSMNLGSDPWSRIVWFFSLAYFLGALLRLARFNAENDHDESAHLCFKGLPSPAAAGCVASLVIFYGYLFAFKETELLFLEKFVGKEALQAAASWIPLFLPFLMLILGYTMVSSRLKYEHVASRMLNRGQSFETFVYLIFGAVLAAVIPELVLPMVFIGYLAFTPLAALVNRLRRTGKGGPGQRPEDRPEDRQELRELPGIPH